MFSASLNQFGALSLEWSKSEIFIPLFLLGTLFVIVGVFMERDGLPERIVAWGWTILIWGLAMELFASIGQLAIDGEIGNRQRSEIVTLEGVSSAQQSTISGQQSKIIELDNDLLSEQRITARERRELNWLVRAVAPRNVTNDSGALIDALKKEDVGHINVAYVDKAEPHMFALQMVGILQSAGIMGRLIVLPSDANVSGAAMHPADAKEAFAKGELAEKTMWDVTNRSFTRIGSGGTLSLSVPESLPENENTLVIGNNDAAYIGMDGQSGEGIDANGRPVPAPQ